MTEDTEEWLARMLAEWQFCRIDTVVKEGHESPQPVDLRWVYVVEEADGDRVKIGRTSGDPMRRIYGHLRAASSTRCLRLVFFMPGAPMIETALHTRFEEHLVPFKQEIFFRRGAVSEMVADRGRSIASEYGAPFVVVPRYENSVGDKTFYGLEMPAAAYGSSST